MDRARTDAEFAAYWRARDKAIACEHAGDHAQARAWWALASLHAREGSDYSPHSQESYQLKRRAHDAKYNALQPLDSN